MDFAFLQGYWPIFAGIFSVICIITIYNNLVSKRNRVKKSLSNIDAFLQQRMDQMENLFTLLDNALDHETKVFDEIANVRAEFSKIKNMYQPDKYSTVVKADQAMSTFITNALATFEKYPELKALNMVEKVMAENIQLETKINASRRQYNSNITLYRNAMQMFPHVIIARLFNFSDNYELYRAEEAARQVVRPRRRGDIQMKHCPYCNTDYKKTENKCPSCHAVDFEIKSD